MCTRVKNSRRVALADPIHLPCHYYIVTIKTLHLDRNAVVSTHMLRAHLQCLPFKILFETSSVLYKLWHVSAALHLVWLYVTYITHTTPQGPYHEAQLCLKSPTTASSDVVWWCRIELCNRFITTSKDDTSAVYGYLNSHGYMRYEVILITFTRRA